MENLRSVDLGFFFFAAALGFGTALGFCLAQAAYFVFTTDFLVLRFACLSQAVVLSLQLPFSYNVLFILKQESFAGFTRTRLRRVSFFWKKDTPLRTPRKKL